jgi:hypothetical protein
MIPMVTVAAPLLSERRWSTWLKVLSVMAAPVRFVGWNRV